VSKTVFVKQSRNHTACFRFYYIPGVYAPSTKY